MNDPVDSSAAPWVAARSLKDSNAVRRNVTALLDELAPEKVLRRADALKVAIETHRMPSGAVLQAPSSALSISWFPDFKSAGELHLVVWRGMVSRRGTPPPQDSAVPVKELVLFPIEASEGPNLWRTAEGVEYDTASLAAHCLALLEEEFDAH